MSTKNYKLLEEAKKLLREAGYTASMGMSINLSIVESEDKCSVSGQCSGGCLPGCYTCSPGNSNPKLTRLDPTIQVMSPGMLEELVTITKMQAPTEEKK